MPGRGKKLLSQLTMRHCLYKCFNISRLKEWKAGLSLLNITKNYHREMKARGKDMIIK